MKPAVCLEKIDPKDSFEFSFAPLQSTVKRRREVETALSRLDFHKEPSFPHVPQRDHYESEKRNRRIEEIQDALCRAARDLCALDDVIRQVTQEIKTTEKSYTSALKRFNRAKALKSVDAAKKETRSAELELQLVRLRGKRLWGETERSKVLKYKAEPTIWELLCQSINPIPYCSGHPALLEVAQTTKRRITNKDKVIDALKGPEILVEFLSVTNARHSDALNYLDDALWDVDAAMENYFENIVQGEIAPNQQSPQSNNSMIVTRPLLSAYDPMEFEHYKCVEGCTFRDPPMATPTNRGYVSPLIEPLFDITECPLLFDGEPATVHQVDEIDAGDADMLLISAVHEGKIKVCIPLMKAATLGGIERALAIADSTQRCRYDPSSLREE